MRPQSSANRVYVLLVISMLTSHVDADFDCLCCYAVEVKILGTPSTDGKTIGYMYEFDCKKIYPLPGLSSQYIGVEFEHKLGYLMTSKDVQRQICQGDPASTDIIYSTTKATTTTSSLPISSSTSTSAPTTSSPPTIKTSTVQSTSTPTTSTKMPTTKLTSPKLTTPKLTTTKLTTLKLTTNKISTASSASSTKTTSLPVSSSKAPSSTTVSTSIKTTHETTSTTTRTTQKTLPPSTASSPATTQSVPTTKITKPITTATTTTTAQTTTTNPQKDSPLKYIGIGYDLLHGNPGGMEITRDGVDPGILLSMRIFQLTTKGLSANDSNPALEVDGHFDDSCIHSNATYIVYNGKSYQDELLRHIAIPNKFHPNFTIDAFTLDGEFVQTRMDTEGSDAKIYRDTITSCQFGTLSYRDDLANISDFSISREFAQDVCNMSETFDASQYFDFLDKWGTSIVMGAKLGTFSVARYKTTDQNLYLYLQNLQKSEDILYPSGPYKGYGSSLTVNWTALSASGNVSTLGNIAMNVAVGTKSNQAPIELTLYPLTEALDPKYWQNVLQRKSFSDICSSVDTSFLHVLSNNIDLAMAKYFDHRRTMDNMNAVLHLTDHGLQFPLTWPYGFYGFPQTTSGCPKSRVNWQEGYRKFDTNDHHPHNYFSFRIEQYLSGLYAANNIQTNFCMKTDVATELHYDRHWPNGSYCVYKYGSCPKGFASGYIYWDDDDGLFSGGNHNAAGGVLPTGTYGSNTKIYYCCRNDAPYTTKMYLPRETPFVLMRFGSACQEVHHMQVRELFVRWDDEDTLNKDSTGGAHPTDGDRHNHLLYFCYYSEIKHGFNPALVG